MEKNILVPFDFQAPSVKAANYARLMAEKFNAGLILLCVIDTP
jgi:nucleotide-binding universal stress UspA family protein